MKWKIHRLSVGPDEEGQRLDQYLSDSITDISRTKAKKFIDIGGVHLNGRRVRSCSRAVKIGDQVELYQDHLPLEPFRLTSDEILYRDKFLIVLNKPAGIDTQPTHARYKGTVYEALQVLLHDPFRPQQKPELGMVQRLDRGTTGLMVFSTHQKSHRGLTKIFMAHQAEKRYLALVENAPEKSSAEIRSFLARSRKENKVVSVLHGGKEAITRYSVRNQFSQASLIALELLTGRSHQIRAHMAESGCPLLGDTRYGGLLEFDGIKLERPMLHAVSLAFPHPVSGEALSFELPMPQDMQSVIEYLKTQ